MTAIICKKCLNIPYIEFLPGLKLKFTCCKSMIITHYELEERINLFYSLKCRKSSCRKKNENINYYYGDLSCEDCLNEKKKILLDKKIKNENIAITCKIHYKKYKYYTQNNIILFCDDCDYPKEVMNLNEFRKEKKNIEIFNSYSLYEDSINYYFKTLFKRAIETYRLYNQNLMPNAFFNLLNIKEFLDNWNILSPICPDCKEIYDINILNNNSTSDNKEIINLKLKCKCINEIFNSIDDVETKINSIICDYCNEVFEQKSILYNIINENNICENCVKKEKIYEYICLNEIGYICIIHKLKYKFYCKTCQKLFCEGCNILYNLLDKHELIKLNESNESAPFENIPEFMDNIKWFKKYKDYRYNMKRFSNKKECTLSNKDRIKQINILFSNVKNRENNSLADINFKNEINIRTIINKIINSIMIKKLSNSHLEISTLKEKINNMEFMNIALLKDLNNKNKIVQLLKTRNIFQHLILNIIKKNYNSFEKIKGDFRILYESYKYLKYELKINDEDNKIKQKIESIFENIEKLIKNTIKKNTEKIIINKFKSININNKLNFNEEIIDGYFAKETNIKKNFNDMMDKTLPKIHFNTKMEIFNKVFENETKTLIDKKIFSILKNYNQFLLNQNLFQNKNKSRFIDIKNTIDNIEENKIPEDFDRSGLGKSIDLIGNYYLDELGYTNDKSLNKNFINQLLRNEQEDNDYQIIAIKKAEVKKFLKEMKCDEDIEFYFLFSLMNKIINRIGNIVHQNRDVYKILFYDLSDELNPKKYELIEDKENKGLFIFSDKKDKNKSISINYLSTKQYNIEDYSTFSKEFFDEYIKQISLLLGEEKEKKISNEIKKEIEDSIGTINFENEIITLSNHLNNAINFHEKFKDLFIVFPCIKNEINNLIEREIELDDIENIEQYVIENLEENKFINIYIKNYLLIILLGKIIESANNNLLDYKNLHQKIYHIKMKDIILKMYKEKLNQEYNILGLFEQEKNNTIKLFEDIKNLKINEIENMKKNKNNNEIQKYTSTIEKMKSISVKDIEEKFKDYLDFDSNSYANSKFDVILYLYQNNYI